MNHNVGYSNDLLERILKSVSAQIEHHPEIDRLLIIVDALDEISSKDVLKVGDVRHNSLGIPEKPHRNIFFLISSRSFRRELYDKDNIKRLFFNDRDEHHKQEVRTYIRQQARDVKNKKIRAWMRRYEPDEEAFVELIFDRCECSFIYLFHVFNNIDAYRKDKDELPQGLDDYYSQQVDRMLGPQNELRPHKKSVLAAINYFKPEISVRSLTDFCGLNEPDVVRTFIREWKRVRMVATDEYDEFARFHHLSFYQFITESSEEICFDLRIKNDGGPPVEIDTGESLYPCFKRLTQSLYNCMDFSSGGMAFTDNLSNAHRKEVLGLVLEMCEKTREPDMLSKLLTNNLFCAELIAHTDYSEHKVVETLESTYAMIKAQEVAPNIAKEKWQKLANDFIDNLVGGYNPIISAQAIDETFLYQSDEFSKYLFSILLR